MTNELLPLFVLLLVLLAELGLSVAVVGCCSRRAQLPPSPLLSDETGSEFSSPGETRLEQALLVLFGGTLPTRSEESPPH